MDGTDRLCHALYGRQATPQDYLGGSEARMLHDAASRLVGMRMAKLRAEDERDAALRRCEELERVLQLAYDDVLQYDEENPGAAEVARHALRTGRTTPQEGE